MMVEKLVWILRIQDWLLSHLPKYLPTRIEIELNASLDLMKLETDPIRRREAGKDLAARIADLAGMGYTTSQLNEYTQRMDTIILTGHDPSPRSDLRRFYKY